MKKLLNLLFVFGLLLFSCNSSNDKGKQETNTSLIKNTHSLKVDFFDFNKFKILKSQLGKIKIGMTIREAEKQLIGLTKKVDDAYNFGFDGGSPAYLYYYRDELILGLIPKLQTDTLIIIIAVHNKLQTINGINPNSKVSDLIKKYPDLKIQKDLMNNWEFFEDKKNGWDFIFMTDEKTEIGEYSELNVPSLPKKIMTRANWITIK